MMRLSDVEQATQGHLLGADHAIDGVGIDSRTIRPHELFVPLPGHQVDGHQFVLDCLQHRAHALVEASWLEQQQDRQMLETQGVVVVDNTHAALGHLAAWWRKQWQGTLIGITGSNGKTTVKEMVASILRQTVPQTEQVLATAGNFNNDIGLPLTLLRLRQRHRYAVIEMGMNHVGEIARLTGMAKPAVAVITNAAGAHLQYLGTVAKVAEAKGEIFQGLSPYGIAVLNADDAFYTYWQGLLEGKHTISFGLGAYASVRAEYTLEATGSTVQLITPQATAACRLKVVGKHNVMNALAACAAALAVAIPLELIVSGLERFEGVSGRLQFRTGVQGSVIIDDTYNANPDSMSAAIGTLAQQGGRRVLVMGDMGELGENGLAEHRAMGALARAADIECLYALGDASHEAVAAFGEGAQHFDTVEDLIKALQPLLGADCVVLVKGSRFMHMERAVHLLASGEQ